MAEHGDVESATATGNDYAEHEATYEWFVYLAFVAVIHALNTLLALAIGGVLGHWYAAGAIFLIATIAALHGLGTRSRLSSVGALILALLTLAAFGLRTG